MYVCGMHQHMLMPKQDLAQGAAQDCMHMILGEFT